MHIIRHQDLDAAQRDAKPLYPTCNQNCNEGRACDCVGDIATVEDDGRPGAGAGVFIWPAVVALALFAAFAVHLWWAA